MLTLASGAGCGICKQKVLARQCCLTCNGAGCDNCVDPFKYPSAAQAADAFAPPPLQEIRICFKRKSARTSPLSKVVVAQFCSEEECRRLVLDSEELCAQLGGWTTRRHKSYPTTDYQFKLLAQAFVDWKEWFQERIDNVIAPMLYQHFAGAQLVRLSDVFVVKYGGGAKQRALSMHRDGSVLSFVVTLNCGFEGGGTIIEALGKTPLVHDIGTIAMHCGKIRHGGNRIGKGGERYILVGFCDIEAGWLNLEASKHRMYDFSSNIWIGDGTMVDWLTKPNCV